MDDDASDIVASSDDCDGIDIFSRQTGHWCSSFADDDGTFVGDDDDAVVEDEAKKGPSRLTPFSPFT